MEITIQTLTPIWTGGVEPGKMDRLHETGLIGSLRWWYEAIVRGLGGYACDPTAHSSCLYDADKPNNGLCDVCRIFGTTGWRRRFRLIIDHCNLTQTWSGAQINIKPPDRNRGWYLNAGQMGTFHIKVIADEQTQARVLALTQFVAQWGSLGARPQLGYGLFEIGAVKNRPHTIYKWDIMGNSSKNSSLPDLRTFTFFTLTFQPQQDDWWRDVPGVSKLTRDNQYRHAVDNLQHHRIIPTTPALKNVLRYGQQWSSGRLPHQFFGTLRGNERSRSKIALSWAYHLPDSSNWQIRGWAYPPQVEQSQQQEIQQRLQAVLGKPETWLRALNIRYRSAKVSIVPAPTFFQAVTHTQIQDFANETLSAEVTV